MSPWLLAILIGREWEPYSVKAFDALPDAPRSHAGALVRLETSTGEHLRWILAGDSYQSSSERRALFNLGAGELPRRLEVTWPSGRRTVLGVSRAGSYLTVAEAPARD